jgi:hypothetical protein
MKESSPSAQTGISPPQIFSKERRRKTGNVPELKSYEAIGAFRGTCPSKTSLKAKAL